MLFMAIANLMEPELIPPDLVDITLIGIIKTEAKV